jgi:uncharacterized protein YggE
MMRRLFILGAAAAVLLTACTPSVSVTNSPSAATGIQVTGQGEVSGTPDTLTIDLGVSLRRDGVSQAATEAADLATRLVDALEAAGVDAKDIQTRNYSIYPEYDYKSDTQTLLGYRVTNTVTAKIHDLQAAGTIIDAATAAGGDAVQVSGVSFSIEDDDALLTDARARAWDDAKAKAEQLASLSGVTLGAPTSITESVSSQPPVYYASDMAGGTAASTPIEPGSQTITVVLNVQFSIGG